MNLSSNYTNLHFKLTKQRSFLLPQNILLESRELRFYYKKRRRLKRAPKLVVVRSSLPSPLDGLKLNSFDFLAPAVLGLASGFGLFLSSRLGESERHGSEEVCNIVGEWLLFTSPTPFNRFVLLRCPSVSFKGSELLEDVNEKLVKEDRHFVRLNTGRILAMTAADEGNALESSRLDYQRVCISAEDGGVISLDWPANLDLKDERGLDTTLLLVPGTAEGSMERSVQSFVCEALKHGLFPVVMNPRGCAGSPLITPRLFTAADSDDICTAVQFINKVRPWTTLMGVGWGYGANMLTKYLAEVGEKTPLTAATCIDNPFDLEEATRSSPHHLALDQMLAGGLIDILRSNKELFQGRAKGFDVEKALSAKSVRDFEKAISMVSYGFEAIEDFYSNSSTQVVVGNVKIPVLFIQNDDETVPLFSIPRGVIAENPFTSLLLCSCSSSNSTARDRAAVIWCQNLTIEWLTAVELGLLKGRHPLLKDVDVTINPSKGLALVEGIASGKGGKVKKIVDLMQSKSVNDYSVDPAAEMLEDGESATSFHFGAGQVSKKDVELDVKGLYEMHNGAVAQTSSVEAEFVEKDEAGAEDGERGEVLLTAEVIMNVLDITMPGILKENEKKKVLAAVDQGETLVKALQDAVPEDVREKLTTAVSGILHAQGTNLKFDGLLDIDRIPSISPVIRSKTSRLVGGISNAEVLSKDSPLSDQMKSSDDLMDDSNNSHPKTDKLVTGLGSEPLPFESSQKSGETGQLISGHHCDISASGRKSSNETGINHENDKFIKEKLSPSSDSSEKGSENGVKPSTINQAEKSGTTEEAISDGYRVDLDVGGARPEIKEDNVEKNEGKTLDSSTDQNKMTSTNMAEQAVSSQVPSSETHQVEKEGNDHQKKENRSAQSVPDPSKSVVSDSNTPAFSVSQALDALTGMDDSTQVAVNSVFGVIENMISQLEYENNDGNEVKDEKIDSLSEKQQIVSDHTLGKKKDNDNDPSDTSHDPHLYNWRENSMYPYSDARTAWVEEQHCQDSISYDENSTDGSHGNNEANKLGMESKKKDNLVGSKLLADYSDRHVNKVLPYMSPNQYWNSLHNEYFPGYLLSELPNTKPLDVDTTAALLLDYYPEEGQWKLLEQPGSVGDSTADVKTNKGMDRQVQTHSPEKSNHADNFIEPSYVILDTEKHQELVGEYEKIDDRSESVKKSDDRSEEMLQFVKVIILDSLKVEVDRRLSASDMKKMKSRFDTDIEKVANAVALAVDHDEGYTYFEGNDINIDCTTEKIGTLHGNNIIRAISSAIQGTSYLRRVVPVGVIVGSSLAALRKYFHVSTAYDGRSDVMATDQTKKSGNKIHEKTSLKEPNEKTNRSSNLNSPIDIKRDEFGSNYSRNDSVMIGAVTAALGASAILVQQKDAQKGEEPIVGSSKSFKEKGTLHKEPDKLEEATSEKNQSNIVTSLAEKAMSVAGPVVPTKEDGEVDQDRLVAMLADLGQKGGILRLVGKIALLWGGLRGAMSLTDRLISFLHIAERPLFQRILGFVSMLLVLWSPVFVPLLPTIVRSWTTSNPSRMAELACIIGLYTAVLILVMLWGKRIRGYENPLQQYGLDLTSSAKIQDSLKGFIGGIIVVLLIQSVNALIGCVSFSWPTSPPSSLGAMTWLKACGQMLILAGWGIITATGVVLVEELLFRSWLPEEISTDLGYHQGIIMSGLVFSLLQRSLTAIPGLWFLSLALAGARQRMEGSLSIPIGFRTGMMASSFVLQRGGFLTYRPNFPVWIIGSHPFEPFSGAVGLAFSLLLATILYPSEHLKGKKGKI